MPDDATTPDKPSAVAESGAVPLTLAAIGAAGLLCGAPMTGLGLIGCWLFRVASEVERDRDSSGRSLKARRAAATRLDVALADSFPASDPPSLSGITS